MAVDGEAVHGFQQRARHFRHLLRRSCQFRRTRRGALHQFAHLFHRLHHPLRARCLFFHRGIDLAGDLVQPRRSARDLRRPVRLLVGGGADFLRELVNFGYHRRDLLQRHVQVVAHGEPLVHDAGALLHVLHGLARFALNAGDEFGDFLGGLRRFFRQLADFLGHHGEAQSVFAGAGGFDGRVQRQKVGLLGKIVDDADNLSDIVGALAERIDNSTRNLDGAIDSIQSVGGLVHGRDAVLHFQPRALADVEQDLGGVGHALDGRDHLVDRGRRLAHARRLHLRVLHHVLHVDRHLMHGAGDFIDGGRCLHTDAGRLVGRARHLVGTAGHLCGAVAYAAHERTQAFHHAREGMAEGIVGRKRLHFDGQIAARDGFRGRRHAFQVTDHGAEAARQLADFVLALAVDFVVQVAGFPDLARGLDQLLEGNGNGARGLVGDA